jgi:drug/metabolite transporter (DMT)-like permease
MSDQASTAKGILWLMTTLLFFSAMDALAKYLISLGYPVIEVIWARYAGQTVLLLAVFARRMKTVLATRHPVAQAARSLFQFGSTALFFFSVSFIGLAEATAIMDVQPVLITLGAALFLGEKIGPRRLASVFVALFGAIIIIRPGTEVFTPYALLPLAGAVSYAGFALVTRWVGQREHPWTSLFYAGLLGTFVTSVLLPGEWMPVATSHLPWFVLLALLGTAGQFCLIRAFTLTEAGVLAPFGYAGLILAAFWGFVVFGEIPDIFTIVGALVIVGAGLYVWHRETLLRRAVPGRS